jgi:type IV secretion system protein VirB6
MSIPDFSTFCYTDCANSNYIKSTMPFTAKLIKCVKGIVNTFLGVDNCSGGALKGFKDQVSNVALSVITIAVILFFFKFLAEQKTEKKDAMTFIAKICLVMYFSIGNGLINHGDLFFNLSDMLASTILNNANGNNLASNGLCNFSPTNYPLGYEYLATFDAIDCRISWYLGFNRIGGMMDSVSSILISTIGILITFIPALLSLYIIFAILVFLLAIFVLSIVANAAVVYSISIIATAMVIYLGPLFVPLVLFEKTKGYFDSWIKVMLSYAIQPVITLCFIAIMFVMYDGLMFNISFDPSTYTTSGGCSFLSGTTGYSSATYFYIDPNNLNADCTSSLGYFINPTTIDNYEVSPMSPPCFFLWACNGLNSGIAWSRIKIMGEIVLFSFVFYFFVDQLGTISSELAGSAGGSLGQVAGSPNAMTNAAIAGVKKLKNKYEESNEEGGGGKAPRPGVK